MSSDRLPVPFFVPAATPGQWTRGEAMDELKLHRRIDVPLEAVGLVQRTWGADFDRFVGAIVAGTALAANVPLTNWTMQIDTAVGYTGVNGIYTIPRDGTYLITTCLTASPAPASTPAVEIGITTASTNPRTMLFGQFAAAVNTNGSAIWSIERCIAGDQFWVQVSAAMTARNPNGCWWAVQQLAY